IESSNLSARVPIGGIVEGAEPRTCQQLRRRYAPYAESPALSLREVPGSDRRGSTLISVRVVEILALADRQIAGIRLARARPRADRSSSARSLAGPVAEHRSNA